MKTAHKQTIDRLKVNKRSLCREIIIPRKYCMIVLKGQAKDMVEIYREYGDLIIENISGDFPCQGGKNRKGGIRYERSNRIIQRTKR